MNDNRPQRFGATLYIPALHHNVDSLRNGSVKNLSSMVICLEDATRDDEVEEAIVSLKNHLEKYDAPTSGPAVYVRPRTPHMAERILAMRGVENIRGFVIPKATADSLPDWISILRGDRHAIMPTIETYHAFDSREVYRIRDQTITLGVTVDTVRIGGNDLLSTIGARRSATRTLYDGPLASVMTTIIGAYAGTGIMLSSPVMEHYSNVSLLKEEIERDIEHGIYNKTAIHPNQVALINDALKPKASDLVEAQAILDDGAKAVFGFDGSMCEPKTHMAWATMIVARANVFGVHNEITAVAV